MATQIIPRREPGDTSQVSADQAVSGTWSGTGTQETGYIDGDQWDIGCRGSVKYDSIMAQMDDFSYSRGVPRHEVTIAMLTDAHWQEVFKMFVNSTVAVHGMSVTECIAHLRAVTFQEAGHEHETATEFLQRYAARAMAMGDVLVSETRLAWQHVTGTGSEERVTQSQCSELRDPKQVVDHLAYQYREKPLVMARIIAKVKVEADREQNVTSVSYTHLTLPTN